MAVRFSPPTELARVRTRRLAVDASGSRERRARVAQRARRRVAGIATRWGLPEAVLDSFEVVAAELISNAALHVGGRILIGLRLSPDGDAVVIEVRDHSRATPDGSRADPFDEHGRGMLLVEALADRWGLTALPDGKRVWARLPVEPPVRMPPPSRTARRAALLADALACGRHGALGPLRAPAAAGCSPRSAPIGDCRAELAR
ncbi:MULTISPECIES: ATP-binding protein [Kitasatospora]|uniref:Anti-sigma regulatory factor (Ser/Thr protein kinase) n=2 Tax=Kitasatospora TaxID=2063 RepID=A0ABT1IWM2_9ACTN|nr:ATP-binding protein [Kitasatospora paracochleata]MCP2308966.1 anti-sigma regulatory factor (Ser/Thr protein kinase) [Kitasatospora paracochleata]